MPFPPALQAGIDELVRVIPPRELEHAARSLSERYRAGGAAASRTARTAADIAAYLATRAPATHAAVEDVCRRIRSARPGWAPSSLLDLGAGPGVASWAATETWPGIRTVTLVEAEAAMVSAGRALAGRADEALRQGAWLTSPVESPATPPAELVVASYVIGELSPRELPGFVDRAWSLAADTLVIVEPGTTAGYRRILTAREAVLRAGGSLLGPCPHERPCPLPDGDWCHFATRLARSRTHRLAKGAERGFEDEKLSYVVLCRSPQQRVEARVIRRPEIRPGHVVLDLCAREGLERRTVSKREGGAYRAARKLRSGDAL
jgi:ribosomal protein RSM22 (predicted rRNA methylase)